MVRWAEELEDDDNDNTQGTTTHTNTPHLYTPHFACTSHKGQQPKHLHHWPDFALVSPLL